MKTFKIDDDHRIDTGFKVPDNYFDTLSEKLIFPLSKPETKVIPFGKEKSWIFAAAAILILALSIPILNAIQPETPQSDVQAIENYLAYSEIPDEQLVDLLEAEEIQKLEINYNLEDQALEDVLSSTINLEQYIID